MDVVSNGKTVQDMQPFLSVIKNFKMLSSLSATDLKGICPTMGLSDVLDNERSMQWTTIPGTNGNRGIGLCNNQAFGSKTVAGSENQMLLSPSQNAGCINGALQKRIAKIVDTTTNSVTNNSYGSNGGATTKALLMSATQLTTELKSYYSVTNNVMTWVDTAIIPMKYISDAMDKIGLVRRADMKLRIWINTGSLTVPVTGADSAAVYYSGGPSNSTFSNVCPFTINLLPATAANGGLPATTAFVAASLSIAKPASTSITAASINLAAGGISNGMPACRMYYSRVKIEPKKALEFIQENTAKEIVFENYLWNQYNAIAAGGTFSSLVQSGIKNPIGIFVIPFISTTAITTVGGAAIGFSQYGSPYDTSPSTFAPLSLTNLNVSLGNTNVLSTSYVYTYENFIQQVALVETLTSSDIGIATGLLNQSCW